MQSSIGVLLVVITPSIISSEIKAPQAEAACGEKKMSSERLLIIINLVMPTGRWQGVLLSLIEILCDIGILSYLPILPPRIGRNSNLFIIL